MSEILPQAPIENEPQLVDLIYELAQTRPRYLRPLEPGAAYYDLSGVERAVDPESETEQDLLTASARRTWEPLGPVYLLEQTLQTLRWSNPRSPPPTTSGACPKRQVTGSRGRRPSTRSKNWCTSCGRDRPPSAATP